MAAESSTGESKDPERIAELLSENIRADNGLVSEYTKSGLGQADTELNAEITHYWTDEDTLFAVYFNDGWVVAATEKGVVTIDGAGQIAGSWWKDEPDDPHYQRYVEDVESLPAPQPIDEAMVELIYQAVAGPEQAVGARQLRDFIVQRAN